jgi:2-C-methyl-D-erythritol 4-phosphate cytidylyltransferase
MMKGAPLWAVVPAAGIGMRMKASRPKQYIELAGKPMLRWTLERLLASPEVVGAVVVLAPNDNWWKRMAFKPAKPILLAKGGTERQDSVLNGLEALKGYAGDEDFVLVHDAARPCLRVDDVERLVVAGRRHPVGALLARRITDTVKRADSAGTVQFTVDRHALWLAQTPQMFRLGTLRKVLQDAKQRNIPVTDEALAMERFDQLPLLVESHGSNIKVTLPEDIALAEYLLTGVRARA